MLFRKKLTYLWYSWKTRTKVFLINIIVIGVFLGIGFLADRLLGHERHFLPIIALVASFPVTVVLLRRFIKADPEMIKNLSGEGSK